VDDLPGPARARVAGAGRLRNQIQNALLTAAAAIEARRMQRAAIGVPFHKFDDSDPSAIGRFVKKLNLAKRRSWRASFAGIAFIA
jgi:hypothetical protein